MKIGYGKLGRSMPLTLEDCGTLGGDIEMTAILVALAKRRPSDDFILVGRNSGQTATEAKLPSNVYNPWAEDWGPKMRTFMRNLKAKHALPNGLTVQTQQEVVQFLDDMVRETFVEMDQYVLWVGQHGTTNAPIPKVDHRGTLTKPYDWSIFYASYLLHGLNAWRDKDPWGREEIWLNADPRNYHKMRDLKWPLRHPILTQYEFTNNIKHERYGDYDAGPYKHVTIDGLNAEDPDVWEAKVHNVYSRIELNALTPGTPSGDLVVFNHDWEYRDPFGIVINEARAIGVRPEMTRLHAMLNWVLPVKPTWIYGTWSAKSTAQLKAAGWELPIQPLPWRAYTNMMHRVRSTFTTPSSGSHWATTKPWESFGMGVVCFFHPEYDKQNHILQDTPEWLQNFLRVPTPQDLKIRVDHLSSAAGRADWETIVDEQRKHFDRAMWNPQYIQMINARLDGGQL